jgi:predicted nucleic acid-binding Zn ribbon protein
MSENMGAPTSRKPKATTKVCSYNGNNILDENSQRKRRLPKLTVMYC